MAARATYGQVEVTIGKDAYVLKPTLDALISIERRFGSVRQAAQMVADLQMDAVCQILGFAAGLSKSEVRDLPEQVFAEGLVKVVAPVSEYLMMLLNPTGESEEKDTEGK